MDRDAQQELHQRSLRNVRAYLDQEEAEAAAERRAPRMLLYALVPAVIAIAALVIWGGGAGRPPAIADKKLHECTMRTWAEMSGEREREIRAQNPGITPSDVGRRLQAENAAIEAAAAHECRKGPR